MALYPAVCFSDAGWAVRPEDGLCGRRRSGAVILPCAFVLHGGMTRAVPQRGDDGVPLPAGEPSDASETLPKGASPGEK